MLPGTFGEVGIPGVGMILHVISRVSQQTFYLDSIYLHFRSVRLVTKLPILFYKGQGQCQAFLYPGQG